MTTQTKIIIAGILTVLAAILAALGVNYIRDLQRAAAQNEQRGQVITTTSELGKDGAVADAGKRGDEQATAGGKTQFTVTLQEAKRNEPETADRAERPVPGSVRRAYAERRRARERSGNAAEER